jgi:hypothetical protein
LVITNVGGAFAPASRNRPNYTGMGVMLQQLENIYE